MHNLCAAAASIVDDHRNASYLNAPQPFAELTDGEAKSGAHTMLLSRLWHVGLFAALTLAGCNGGSNLGPASSEEREALIRSASASAPNLQPGEKIKVTVYGEDRLSGEYEIDPAGYVSLPLAGTVKAAGLSKPDLEKELSKRFRGEYLRNPKVTVDVASFRPFYILGEVTKPGEYAYRSGLNLMSAAALAGGTTYRASRSTALIQHVGEQGFKEYPLSPTIPVLPGDLIRIPERYF